MANTYTLISSSTVGAGGTSTISFTSIPSTYNDLCLVISGRTNRASYVDDFVVRPNGSSSNGKSLRLYVVNTSVGCDSHTDIRGMMEGNSATSSVFGNSSVYITNYTGSNNKAISIDSVMENNSTDNFNAVLASLWSNSAVISSLDIVSGSGSTFLQYTTAYLYGIKNS